LKTVWQVTNSCEKNVSTVFADANLTSSSSLNHLSSSKRFKFGKTRTRHNHLPLIIANFYYEATKLLQADNYVIIISNLMAW